MGKEVPSSFPNKKSSQVFVIARVSVSMLLSVIISTTSTSGLASVALVSDLNWNPYLFDSR